MIQANELRIGNTLDVAGNWWHVDSVIPNGENDYELYFKENDQYDHSANAKPIPLTTEVLGRCGFVERADEEDNPHWFSPFGIPNIEEFVIHLTTTIEDVTNNTHLSGLTFDGYKKILYLHQLQNLVFALTGQELKISEK